MRSIRNATAAVLLTFGTIQMAAQAPGTIQAGGMAPQVSSSAPATVGGIEGNVLTSTNGQAADKRVRLRDGQSGRVVASQVTDNTGAFSFANVDPGNYIVEVVGKNGSVLGASSIVTLHAGEIVTTAIKLPLRMSGGILGSTAAMATIVAAGAAAAGVLAVHTVGDPTCPQ
jgi:Carboxypeptidase regulatory-like domain